MARTVDERDESTVVDRFEVLNAMGQPRTIAIRKNGWFCYTWRLIYQDNPALADREHAYTTNWFASPSAARRSARRFTRTLGQ